MDGTLKTLLESNVQSFARDNIRMAEDSMLDDGMRMMLESAGLTNVDAMYADFLKNMNVLVDRCERRGYVADVDCDAICIQSGLIAPPTVVQNNNVSDLSEFIVICDDDCYECTITTYCIHTIEIVLIPNEVSKIKLERDVSYAAEIVRLAQEDDISVRHFPPIVVANYRMHFDTELNKFYNGSYPLFYSGGRVFLEGVDIEAPIVGGRRDKYRSIGFCGSGYPIYTLRIDKDVTFGFFSAGGVIHRIQMSQYKYGQYFVNGKNYWSLHPKHTIVVDGASVTVFPVVRCERGGYRSDGLVKWFQRGVPSWYCNQHKNKYKKGSGFDLVPSGCSRAAAYCMLRLLRDKRIPGSGKIRFNVPRLHSLLSLDTQFDIRQKFLFILNMIGGYVYHGQICLDYVICPNCVCASCAAQLTLMK